MTNETTKTVPPGYMEKADGTLTPRDKVKPVDLDRDKTVKALVKKALKASADLSAFKADAFDTIQAFMDRSAAKYDTTLGGVGGNVTLTTYDGRYKVQRAVSKSLVFDERLQVAKKLIDECIQTWAKGANHNIQALINDAFQVDKEGKISVERVLGLRRIAIEDEKWDRAMKAIADSIQVAGSKSYIRIYERAMDGTYVPIPLDVASAIPERLATSPANDGPDTAGDKDAAA